MDWATPRLRDRRRLGLFSAGVSRAAFSHNGRLVAFLGYAAPNSLQALEVTVFEVGSRRLVKVLPIANSSVVSLEGGIAFSPDDSRLAAGANAITIWDAQSWTETVRAPGPFADGPYNGGDLLGLAYSRDGGRIVAAYSKVWGPGEIRVGGRDEFLRLSEATRLAYAAGKAPDAYQRPEIEVLDAPTGERMKRFALVHGGDRGDRTLITSGLNLSQDGLFAYVAEIDWEGLFATPPAHITPRISVERVELESGDVSVVFEGRLEDRFTALAVNADQSLFATGEGVGNKESWRGADGTSVGHETTDPVRIRSTGDGALRSELRPTAGGVWQLKFLPDESGMMVCQTDNLTHNLMAIWDTKTKSVAGVVHIETPHPAVVSCALSQDGHRAVLTVRTGEAFGILSRDTAYLVDTSSLAPRTR